MREKIIKNRKYILITLAFLLALTFNIGMRYLATRPRYKTLPEVRLVNQKEESTKGFAIMVQNESGDGYIEYEGDTWPSVEEGYEFKEAKCIDNEGQLVEGALTFKDGKATLTTSQTVYCTMYFDKKPETIKILREKDTQGYLSEDPQGGMYRYQVAPSSSSDAANMTNWICFGTKDQSACKNDIDKYMYRIIGITEDGQLYLIKETFLKEGSTTTFQWHSKFSFSDCNGTACDWPNVDLFKRLNGKGGTISKTNLFIDSTQYDYLKSEANIVDGEPQPSEWYNLIESHNWMYGDIGDSDKLNTYDGKILYDIETGNQQTGQVKHYTGTSSSNITQTTYRWTGNVDAKISLMYVHDYYLAYPAGIPGRYTNAQKSWIFFQKDGYNTSSSYEWLSTRWGVFGTSSTYFIAVNVNDNGNWWYYSLYSPSAGRPVFYLSSEAKIVDGDGTKEKPYILDVK